MNSQAQIYKNLFSVICLYTHLGSSFANVINDVHCLLSVLDKANPTVIYLL